MKTKSQLQVLRDCFFDRLFDNDGHSSQGESKDALIYRLALLATPGFMLSLFMLMRGLGPLSGTAGMRYVFVCCSMVVTGVVMVNKWDALYPDRLDYRILTSLPIPAERLFIARIAALAKFVSLYVAAVGGLPLLVVPLVFSMNTPSLGWVVWPRAFAAHALGTIGGSLFMVFLFLAVHGILINLLTPSAFRKISPHIQATAIATLVGILMVIPLTAGSIEAAAENNNRLFDFFPLAWFLGIYQVVFPVDASAGAWTRWAWVAVVATTTAALVSIVTYGAGYRRHARKLLESIDSGNRPSSTLHSAWLRFLNRTVLRNGFERAVFHFIDTVSRRSHRHRVVRAAYIGAGSALAMSSLFAIDSNQSFQLSETGVLEAPFILSFLVVTGTRFTFSLPHVLKANWVFQLTRGTGMDFVKAARKWVVLFRVLPLYALMAFFECALFGLDQGVRHLLFNSAMTWLLVEVCFFDFRKIPFTFTRKAHKLELALVAVAYCFAFSLFVNVGVRLQIMVVGGISSMAAFLVLAGVASAVLAEYARRNPTAVLIDLRIDDEIQQLNLS